jgi:putative secretion ATPase (PEP-CTERM system associated)
MYEKFFKLNAKPFELIPNPDFLFLSKSHKKSMTYLEYGLRERAGFILLTGEVGSGKTTLVRNLIKKLEHNTVLSKVFNTMVSSVQLFSMINEDFGLSVAGKDKITLIRELNDFLIDCYSKNRKAVLIIDEAQNLTPELLEEVRMLSNLEADRSKLLQIILSGQPELLKILSNPGLRQLRQRISICCNIYPLTRQETEEYILYRLEVAGNRNAVTFEEGAFEAIHAFSKGIPRLVNIIADYLMLAAFADSTSTISMDIVEEVRGELEKDNMYWPDEQEAAQPGPAFKDLAGRLERIERELSMYQVSADERWGMEERIINIEKLLKQFCQFVLEKKSGA